MTVEYAVVITIVTKRTGIRKLYRTYSEKKLNLFSHISKIPDDRRPKRVVFGIMEGSNIGGRPRKRWTDNVKGWCNNMYIYHGRGRLDRMANGIESMDLDDDDDDDRIYLYSIIKAGSELTVLGC